MPLKIEDRDDELMHLFSIKITSSKIFQLFSLLDQTTILIIGAHSHCR
jgi:hypothetical protein